MAEFIKKKVNSMSKGLKRICMNCGARFYDLDKSPIICPSCDTEFTGEIKVKSRRGRPPAEDKPAKAPAKAAPVAEEEEEDVEDIDPDDDIVSLDDVDEDDDIKANDEDDDEDMPSSDLDDNFDSIDDDEDDIEEDDDEEEETK